MNEVQIFINRLKKIGIELELMGNVPWIYLNKVNGNRVQPEDYNANHGFTIAWNRDKIQLYLLLQSYWEIRNIKCEKQNQKYFK